MNDRGWTIRDWGSSTVVVMGMPMTARKYRRWQRPSNADACTDCNNATCGDDACKRALKPATSPTTFRVNCGIACDADDAFDSTLCGGTDCDDSDPNAEPGAGGAFGDGIDSDCDGGDGTCGDGVQQGVEEY